MYRLLYHWWVFFYLLVSSWPRHLHTIASRFVGIENQQEKTQHYKGASDALSPGKASNSPDCARQIRDAKLIIQRKSTAVEAI